MKKLKVFFIVISIILISLAGCSSENTSYYDNWNESGYKLYYVSDDNCKLYYDSYDITSSDMQDKINDILVELKKGDYEKASNPTIPNDVVTSTFRVNDNILVLNFDESYNKLKGLEEILRRAAIVRTFCQLGEITYVRINVDSKPLEINGEPIGNMNEDTFIDNVGANASYVSFSESNIYYTNSYGDKLKKLPVRLEGDGTKCVEQLAVEKLIEGPAKIGYYDVLSSNTEVNRFVIHDKRCYIDFSEDFLEKTKGVTDEVKVYSIVNTLTEFSSVNKVLITINGDRISESVGGINLNDFVEHNFELNEDKE